MKKVVLNISDVEYEKFKYEAILEGKNIPTLIKERIFFKPFCKEVEEAFDAWCHQQLQKILKEEI